jgi:hypothetical protein
METTTKNGNNRFQWRPLFQELSLRFLEFEKSQEDLIDILKQSSIAKGFEDEDKDGKKIQLSEIDPFSAWSLILKHGDTRRIEILKNIKKILSLKSEVPDNFHGVPSVHAQQAWYFPYLYERDDKHIPLLWTLFHKAIKGSVTDVLFNSLLQFKLIAIAKLTSGLFFANPEKYLPINLQTRPFIESFGISPKVENYIDYINVMNRLKVEQPDKSIYELSYEAWELGGGSLPDNIDEDDDLSDEIASSSNLWNISTKLDKDAETTEDLLNRKEFAAYLAVEINDLMQRSLESEKSKDKSSIFNIYGAWGSGKSTFVKMLKEHLKDVPLKLHEKEHQWINVDFNAWRNQHVKPVWWSLLDHLTNQMNNQEPNFFKRQWFEIKEWVWRINAAYGFWLLVPMSMILMIFGIDWDNYQLKGLKTIGGVVTSVVTILGAGVVAMRALFSGAGIAKLFQTLHRDPYHYVIEHYKGALTNHNSRPVFVFIDDLDRCSASYVVELLECLHTFFSSKQVFVMVAADRTWISNCFEEVYDGKGSSANEIGRPRGYLFLEKIFQVSVGLPVVNNYIKDKFVSNLLGQKYEGTDDIPAHVKETLEAILQEATNEDELTKKGQKLLLEGFTQGDIAEASTKVSGSEIFRESRKHRLARFQSIMDTNPRNIKLLINVYGIYINLFRMGGRVELRSELLDQIALWSILNIRYPRLAEFLEADINKLDLIHEYYDKLSVKDTPESFESLPADIQSIVKNNAVREVIRGGDISTIDNKSVIDGLSSEFMGELIGIEDTIV